MQEQKNILIILSNPEFKIAAICKIIVLYLLIKNKQNRYESRNLRVPLPTTTRRIRSSDIFKCGWVMFSSRMQS